MLTWLKTKLHNLQRPYSDFMVLSTQDPDHPYSDKPYSQRVYELRGYLRNGFLEILLNTYQGVVLRNLMVMLQKYQQLAFTQLSAGLSNAAAVSAFRSLFPLYAGVTIAITAINSFTRIWRTQQFYRSSKRLINTTHRGNNTQDINHASLEADLKQSIATDRNPKRITDIPKGYHNLTQNMILAPLEVTMYLMILGGNILGIIGVLSVGLGITQTYLSKQSRAAQRQQNDTQRDANNSILNNHISTTGTNLNADYWVKLNEIYLDLTKFLSFSIFQVALMFACAHFIFIGQYDMAMGIAQTATGVLAFQRISKYIGLIKNHGDLDMNMSQKRETYTRFGVNNAAITGDPLDNLAGNLPSYRWSVAKKIVLYSFFILAVLGALYSPLPAELLSLIPRLSLTQIINLGGVALFTGMISFRNTQVCLIDSTLVSGSIKVLCVYFGLASGIYFAPLVPSLIQLALQNIQLVGTYAGIALPLVAFIDNFCIPSILFIFDHIATWVSQEIVTVCKMPSYIASEIFNSASNIVNRVQGKAPVLSPAIDPLDMRYDIPLPV